MLDFILPAWNIGVEIFETIFQTLKSPFRIFLSSFVEVPADEVKNIDGNLSLLDCAKL